MSCIAPALVSVAMLAPAVTATAACGAGDWGPTWQLQGFYFLTTVDGQAPPVALWSENGQTFWLLSETLEFNGGGGVTRTYSWRRDSAGVVGVEVRNESLRQQYRVHADSVTLGFLGPCPPNADCLAPDHGVFARDSVSLASPLYSGRQLRYQRAGEL